MKMPNKPTNQALLMQMMRAGPLPDAEELEKYERVTAGLADRIMRMAENQAAHRQSIEKTNARNSTLGVVAAFILGVLTISGGVFLAYFGRELSGTIIGSTGLIGLAGVFIYGTRSSRNERAEKRKDIRQ